MVIAQLSLPLSCQSPLCLHHLLSLVGTARGLVSLGGIEVLQAAAGVAAATAQARVSELSADRVVTRTARSRRATAVCNPVSHH